MRKPALLDYAMRRVCSVFGCMRAFECRIAPTNREEDGRGRAEEQVYTLKVIAKLTDGSTDPQTVRHAILEKLMHFQTMQLKICEGCGNLWVRQAARLTVYCGRCERKLAEYPLAGAARRPGRKRKSVHAVQGRIQ